MPHPAADHMRTWHRFCLRAYVILQYKPTFQVCVHKAAILAPSAQTRQNRAVISTPSWISSAVRSRALRSSAAKGKFAPNLQP